MRNIPVPIKVHSNITINIKIDKVWDVEMNIIQNTEWNKYGIE